MVTKFSKKANLTTAGRFDETVLKKTSRKKYIIASWIILPALIFDIVATDNEKYVVVCNQLKETTLAKSVPCDAKNYINSVLEVTVREGGFQWTNERPKPQERDYRPDNPISLIRSDEPHLMWALLCGLLRCRLWGKNFNLRALVSFVE